MAERFSGAAGRSASADRAAVGGGGGGKSDGKKGGGGAPARGGLQTRGKAARFFAGGNSYPVCFDFNKPGGCTRRPAKGCGCDDGRGGVFAHACNYFSTTRNMYCLAVHSRVGNH